MCRMLTSDEFAEECLNPKFCAFCLTIRDDVEVIDNLCADCRKS